MEALRITSDNNGVHSIKDLKERNLRHGNYVFYWGLDYERPKCLWVSGGFIDREKKFSMRVKNPYQVLTAISTKNKVIVRIGNEEDQIEFEIDFSQGDIEFFETGEDFL